MKPLLTKELAKNFLELLVWFSNNPQEQSRMGLAKEHVLRMTTNLLKLYEYETGFMQEGKMMQILEKIAREGVPKSAQEKVLQTPPTKAESWQKTLETFQKWQELATKAKAAPLPPGEQVQLILTARDVERDTERAEQGIISPSPQAPAIPEQATPARAVRPVLAPEEPETGEQEVPAQRAGGKVTEKQRLFYLLLKPRSLPGKVTDQLRRFLPFAPKLSKSQQAQRILEAALTRLQVENSKLGPTTASILRPRVPQIAEILASGELAEQTFGQAQFIPSEKNLQELTGLLSPREIQGLRLLGTEINTSGELQVTSQQEKLASATAPRPRGFGFQTLLLRFWVRVLEPVLILPRFRWLRLSIGGGAFVASFIPLPLAPQVLGPVQAGLRAGGGASLATEGLRAPGLRALGGGALRKGAAVAARSLAAISTGVAAALSALWPVLAVMVAIVVVALPLYLLFTHSSETATVAETGGVAEFEGLPPGFEPPPAIPIENIAFRWPVESTSCTQKFGQNRHEGIDINGSLNGTPIRPIANGVVVQIGTAWPYGGHVVIQHSSQPLLSSLYAHMSEIARNIREGTEVTTETEIGSVGGTGNSTGPHLHLSVSNFCTSSNCFQSFNQTTNPCSYLDCSESCR